MQWDASAFAGFSTAEPWLPLAEDFAANNVARQRAEPGSLLNLYKRLIALRRAGPALSQGAYRPLEADGDVLAYMREEAGERVLVALNFGAEGVALALPCPGTVLLSSDVGRDGENMAFSSTLRAHEGVIVALAT